MDLLLSPLLLLITFLLCTPLLLFLFFRHAGPNVNLPPGSTGWPIVGETVRLFVRGRGGKPETFILDRMQKYSPKVFKTSLFGNNMAIFCGAAGNKFLFSNENKILAFWWPPSVSEILSLPPLQDYTSAESRKLRSILPEFLRPESLRGYVAIMDSMMRAHLEKEWVPHKEVKVLPLVKDYTFAVAMRVFLSVEDPGQVRRILDPFTVVREGLISVPLRIPGTLFSRAVEAGRVVQRELLQVIGRRREELVVREREEVAQDLLTRMLLANETESGKFTDDREIAGLIIGLLLAGHDTASAAVTSVISYLAELPHVYDCVLKEQMEIAKTKGEGETLRWDDIQKMKYSWNVVNEAMRLVPPARGGFRVAISDFDFAGFTIPKGWKAYWSVHTTNKNPEYFPDPEKFDPMRFQGQGPAPYTFLPFGAGPRMCPGREFARLEILVFLHHVATKFKWEKKFPNERIIYNPSPTPIHGLPIYLQAID